MAMRTVEFRFATGLMRRIFGNARLTGSWDGAGLYSDQWSGCPMTEGVGEDGCPAFTATVRLDITDKDKTFRWGVLLDGPQGTDSWGIPAEVQVIDSASRYREFRLTDGPSPQVETFYFVYNRRLGANKHYPAGGAEACLRFAVWAPNAKKVEVVFGLPDSGYIYDDGRGIDPSRPAIPMNPAGGGIWESAPLPGYASFEGLPYMYRIENAQGVTVYRTDIFSRSQIGYGAINPAAGHWPGTVDTLDGTKSCSLVVDPDKVAGDFRPAAEGPDPRIPADEFWSTEFTPGLALPSRVEDLIIYELHVGALGAGKPGPGTLSDAISFLDHLCLLGVNAVELLPMSEFSGDVSWGYGDTHHLCIETSAGGRDEYRHFIRECHRRGIAVIQDVVYNHYDQDSERAEWQYDSDAPEQNIYYWYEGLPGQYARPDGGYLNNGSSGYAPRFYEEAVRQQFIGGAVFLVEEMHVDGFRVDLTQAVHRDNTLNADGRAVGAANVFGQKFFREWSRTLRMIRPEVMLIAEDHTGWDAVTRPASEGGLGFDAAWFARFYHSLIGDSDMAGGEARLLKLAGYGDNGRIPFDRFSAALYDSRCRKVVYHKNHDECGNAQGTERTVVTAVNCAPVWGATRTVAEARSRVAFGLSLLSAGTPMFFMGEEVAAQKKYTTGNVLANREDISGERAGLGAAMFRFYRDAVALSRRLRSTRSRNIDILHQSNTDRVVAFKRWTGSEEIIAVASLNNAPFENGYLIRKDNTGIPDADWKEIFNSDAGAYGGGDVGNCGASIRSADGRIRINIPANGFLVFIRQ